MIAPPIARAVASRVRGVVYPVRGLTGGFARQRAAQILDDAYYHNDFS
jgi:hypothetical protein